MTDRELLIAAMRVVEAECLLDDKRSALAIATRSCSSHIAQYQDEFKAAQDVVLDRMMELPNEAWNILDQSREDANARKGAIGNGRG